MGTATINVLAVSGGNYTWSSEVTTTFTIGKGTYSVSVSKTVDIVKNRTTAQTGSLTAADFFTTAPADAKIESVSGTPGSVMSSVTVTGGTLNYASKTSITATADESYTVSISGKNYNNITATLKFHPTDKQPQAALTISSANSVTYGQTLTLTTSGGSGSGAVSYEIVTGGTGTAAIADGVLTPTKAGTVQVKATKAADDTYEAVSSAEFTVTINKATPTGTPTYAAITTSGKTLTDAALTANTSWPAGTVKWVDAGGTALATSTVVAANTSYTWKFTPTDSDNYNSISDTVTLWHKSSSSGGGSGGSSASTYTITVEKTKHGDISVSPKNASKGDTVTITVAPDKGYELEPLTVLDKSGKEVKLTKKGGKYTFKMPASKVTVKATFADDNTMLNFFVDVPTDAYYYDAVLWAAENGITGGIDAVHFAPNAACTRAQSVTFLYRSVK